MTDKYTVPLAGPILDDNAGTSTADHATGPITSPGLPTPGPGIPTLCVVNLPDGCYRVSYQPFGIGTTYNGTVRVDRGEGSLKVSGDLYSFPPVLSPAGAPLSSFPIRPRGIPIYPRNRYNSYLKGMSVALVSPTCTGSITFQQYDYTQPPAGSFNGTFPASPGSRTVTMTFKQVATPKFWPGPFYTGQWIVGGVAKGSVSLGWVSKSFRTCTIEIDTLVGSVAPQPVPGPGGVGTEDFKTVLASAGWSANVIYDQTNVPKPAAVAKANDCWTAANLHALMLTIRKPTTNLDAEWRMHVLVVPAKITCGRGQMYDTIEVPREGVASFSDDGYPSSDSANFGTAADKKQRDVPRAFLRSASHEVMHGFNQIHQEDEGGPDNSIMTTTPSVADVLGTAVTGAPGVFPTDIVLKANANVRHHLIHFPDPVVRPGGHTFASWASTPVPSADRVDIGAEHLSLKVKAAHSKVALGEPVVLEWALRNTGDRTAAVPSEVTTESTYAKLTVVDAFGRRHLVAPFIIADDGTHITPLAPDEERTAGTRAFWSSNGFAFERPGRYTIEVSVEWTASGVPVAVRGTTDVFVSYPTAESDNAAAANLLHPEVGKWVALGGGAHHLTEAVERIQATVDLGDAKARGVAADTTPADDAGPLRGFAGILP